MKKLTNSVFAMMAKVAFVAALAFSLPVMNSCTKDSTEQETPSAGGGYTTTMNAELTCTSSSQSLSLTFDTEAAYKLEVEGGDWFSFAIGGKGSKAGSHTAKANVTENTADAPRSVDIYIKVDGYKRAKIFTVTQSAKATASVEAVVKWMDSRLSTEYYWLDEYNQMVEADQVDYTLAYDKFLSTHLLAMKTNEDDGYYYTDINGKTQRKLYSNIQRYTTSRAETRASMVTGLGLVLCPMVWQLSDGFMPTYGIPVEHVYPGSPAEKAGIVRGDIIAQVNGMDLSMTSCSEELAKLATSAYSSVSISKMVADEAAQQWVYETVNLVAGEYHNNPVAYCGLLEENEESGFVFDGKKIGYIVYLSFESNYDEELINSIKDLKAQGATDVIVDLRANGGGSVLSAAYFGSMLTSSDKAGKNMVIVERNKANAYGTTKVPFVNEAVINNKQVTLPHFDLPEVWVITTSSTASASEMLVMGLRSQGVNVYTIGETTNGKNCGMDVSYRNYGSYTYEFAPITFMAKYDNYDVDYADGIVPNIRLTDYIDYFSSDSYMYYAIAIYPIPDMGMLWGEYLYDIAVSEAVARIIGGTIFMDEDGEPLIDDIGPGARAIKSPLANPVTRVSSLPRFAKSDLKVNMPAKGMRLTENDREIILQAQGIEE